MDENALDARLLKIYRPMSVREIAYSLGMSLPSCYRSVRRLMQDSLATVDGTALTQDGKRYAKYISNVHEYTVELKNGAARCTILRRDGTRVEEPINKESQEASTGNQGRSE